MTLRAAMITLDTTDPRTLAAWWVGAVGGEVRDDWGDFLLTRLDGFPVAVGFQRVGEPKAGKNRCHWDLTAPDREAAVAELVDKGARRLADHDAGGFAWTVMADPEGNEFCVAGSGDH